MLRKLLAYSGTAFVVQLVLGLITLVVELFVADKLTTAEFGEYEHYLFMINILGAPFTVGNDHNLITYLNASDENTIVELYEKLKL